MKIVKKMLIIIIASFILINNVNAKNNLSNAIELANQHYLSRYDYAPTYSRYIKIPNSNNFYKNTYNVNGVNTTVFNNGLGGLLSKEEFEITTKGLSNSYSYLYEATDFWTYTKNDSNEMYVVGANKESYYPSSSLYGTKVTEYVKNEASVSGSGTYTDPWIFSPQYRVTIYVNDDSKGLIVTPNGDENKIEFELSQEGTRDLTIKPSGGYQYLGNTCGVIINDYDIKQDPKKNILKIQGVTRDIECTINFGEKPIQVNIDHSSSNTYTEPKTLYVLREKGWFKDEFANISIEKVKNATKIGYIYKGYYTKPNTLTKYDQSCTNGIQIIDANGIIKKSYEIPENEFNAMTTLYPCYRPIRYTVSFNCGSGATSSISPNPQIHTYGSSNLLPSTGCTKTGYTFNGWKDSAGIKYNLGQSVNLSSIDNSIVELTATYSANTYTISYNLGTGGVKGSTSPASGVYDNSVNISYPKKAGYSFSGWKINKTGGKYGNSSTNITSQITSTTTAYKSQWFKNLAPSGVVTLTATWTQCSAGTYNDGNSSSCTTCPAGTYSAAGATACTKCSPGTYSSSGASSCTKCSAGTYNPNTGSTSSSACLTCNAGTYSAAGSSSCTNCAAGKYNPNTGSTSSSACLTCPAGTYSGTGSSKCTNCAAGKYNPNTGSASSSACLTCPVGTYSASGSSSCTNCAAGTYNPNTGSTSSSACLTCPGGTYSGAKASSCTNCAAGTYSSAGSSKCTTCPVGTYSGAKASSCTKCPAGTYNPNTGSTSSSACIKCAAGKYNASTGQSSCTNCPAGTYNSNTGSTSSSACLTCAAGKYSTAGSSSCTNCPAGKYNPNSGGTSSSACLNCSAGTYSASGATSCTACATCYTNTAGSSSCPTKKTYTISYNANGGSSTPSSQSKICGENLTLRGAISRTGYTFTGWKATNGTTYAAGATYTANEATTLTAQWKVNFDLLNSYSCANGKVGSSPYSMTYTGNCTVINDGSGNWRVKFLTSGTLTFSSAQTIDIFLVGAGGAGGRGGNIFGGGGGGGGKTKTVKGISYTSGSLTVGTGKAKSNGGTTSGFGYSASGGTKGEDWETGGSGGSGGGGGGGVSGEGGWFASNGGAGGSNGGNGSPGGTVGKGQGSTTREFGSSSGTLYSGGGGGGGGRWHDSTTSRGAGGSGGGGKGRAFSTGRGAIGYAGTANTGGGGGGSASPRCEEWEGCEYYGAGSNSAAGGSGIIVIRNKR